MMRSGKLLAEDSPTALMETYQQSNLENVFLSLCMKTDEDEAEPDKEAVSVVTYDLSDRSDKMSKSTPETSEFGPGVCHNLLQWSRMKALLAKNFIRMRRNLVFLLAQFVIPTLLVILFFLAIGREPKGMTVAVVNEEVGGGGCLSWSEGCLLEQDLSLSKKKEVEVKDEWSDFEDFEPEVQLSEGKLNYSCRFLSFLDESVVRPVYFDNFQSAYESVLRAEHWGLIHFHSNYSQALRQRIPNLQDLALSQVGMDGGEESQDTVNNSNVHVYMDMTNQQVGFTVQIKLVETFQAYGVSVLTSCGIPENLLSLPLQFETPVYGSNEPTFTEFMAPGVILYIIYFMAMGLTSMAFILERKEGLLDRSWMAGVTSLEVTLAYVAAQCVVMVVQVTFVLIFALIVFQVRRE